MTDTPVAIVTGAAQGYGAAICKLLLKQGYKVCVFDVQGVKGKNFVKEQQEVYGAGNIIFFKGDVSEEDHYEKAFDITIKTFGKVDVLVNNAGILLEKDPWRVLEVNLMGPINGCQKALKYMGKTKGGKGGVVINVSSFAGFTPHFAVPVYVASKHGIIGLTRSYGQPYHFNRDGVIFMALCPRHMDTDLLKSAKDQIIVPDADVIDVFKMSPEYAAKGVLKLLEDRINGSTLIIFQDSNLYVDYENGLKDCPPNELKLFH